MSPENPEPRRMLHKNNFVLTIILLREGTSRAQIFKKKTLKKCLSPICCKSNALLL